MKSIIVAVALFVSSLPASAADRVYIGIGSIICDTEAAAMQILASDLEYDGTKGNCIVTTQPLSGIDLDKCGMLNPICAYDVGGLIVYADKSWIKR